MRFILGSGFSAIDSPEPIAYLNHDNWNDWFEFETLYSLTIVQNGQRLDVGGVKIGQHDQTARVPDLPEEFE